MKLRPRFSLSTLLLASLFAGGVMFVWRVREPWTLRTWPLAPAKDNSDWWDFSVEISGNPYSVDFSGAGNCLLVKPAQFGDPMGLVSNQLQSVLDLNSGLILNSFPTEVESLWHPLQDVLVQRIYDKVRCVQYPEGQVRAEFDTLPRTRLAFTKTGRWLKWHNPETAHTTLYLRDTRDWTRVHAFGVKALLYDFTLTRDNRRITLCSPQSSDELTSFDVALVDIDSEKELWRFKTPAKFNRCYVAFDRWESILSVTGVHNKSDIRCCYRLDSGTGTMLSENSESYRARCGGCYRIERRPKSAISPDGQRTCRIEKDLTTLTLEETATKRAIVALDAGGERIVPPLAISPDNRRITASLRDQKLAVWTLHRTHQEWWGLYERPELWLAIALFALLLRSILRDARPSFAS